MFIFVCSETLQYIKSDSLRSYRLSLAVYRLSAANKAALRYDNDLFSIWKTISPTGTCVNQSVKRQTHTHWGAHTKGYTLIYTRIHSQQPKYTQREEKVNLEGNGEWSFHSDICSILETDGEPIRPPGASVTLRLPYHPSTPPLNLHLGTLDRWHLANVTLLLPWKIIYMVIT